MSARTAEANRLRCRAWHADNKERVNAKKRARYAADPTYAAANRATAKAWRAAHPKRHKRNMQDWGLKTRYGMTRLEYEQRVFAQGGVCAICGNAEAGKELNVDHDHATGQVRALLCSACNWGLGYFADDPQRLVNAARYVQLGGRIDLSQGNVNVAPPGGGPVDMISRPVGGRVGTWERK